jgi:hypothetical protein
MPFAPNSLIEKKLMANLCSSFSIHHDQRHLETSTIITDESGDKSLIEWNVWFQFMSRGDDEHDIRPTSIWYAAYSEIGSRSATFFIPCKSLSVVEDY